MLRLVVTQVCADCSRPVDVRVTRSPRSLRTVQRASQSLTRVVFEPAQEVVHDLPDHLSRRFKRFAGNRSAQRDEICDKVDICLQRRKEFRFEHQSP